MHTSVCTKLWEIVCAYDFEQNSILTFDLLVQGSCKAEI